MNRRNLCIQGAPTVSFTFDDFPKSALSAGGAILKQHGPRGTYYAVMGLMIPMTSLVNILALSLWSSFCATAMNSEGIRTATSVAADCQRPTIARRVEKGQQAVRQVIGQNKAHNSAYPMGHVNIAAKQGAGAVSGSCRCSRSGINSGLAGLRILPVDAALCLFLQSEQVPDSSVDMSPSAQ